MSKKGKSFWDNPFGGMFDFNNDGKEDFAEQWLGYKVFSEIDEESDDSSGDDYDYSNHGYDWHQQYQDGSQYLLDPYDFEYEDDYEEALHAVKYAWRNRCEDGSQYGLDPEDFETEREYLEALEEKTAWRYYCEDGSDYGIDPEDYATEEEYEEALEEAKEDYENDENAKIVSRLLSLSLTKGDVEDEESVKDESEEIDEKAYANKRRYNAAVTLTDNFIIYSTGEYGIKLKECCQFILDNADKVIAANYLTHSNGFLYAQAIKDNFTLSCSLPDEDEEREMELSDILCKIAKRDIPLSFEIWSWCIDTFLPYAKYDRCCKSDLSESVIDYFWGFPKEYGKELIGYMDEHEAFCQTIISICPSLNYSIYELIADAICEKKYKVADILFKGSLKKACDDCKDWKEINNLVSGVIHQCKNYEELESVEYFRDTFFPLIKAIQIGMVQDEIEEWEAVMAEYIERVEDTCEQYAYTRKNAWRKNAPSGEEYCLDPVYYATEEEYLKALNYEKYGWREWCKNRNNYGLDPNQYETQEEFNKAWREKVNEAKRREYEKRMKEQKLAEQAKMQEYEKDKTIYTYCGVILPFSNRVYHFRTNDSNIKIGDEVIVSVGENEQETKGKVVSVGQYSRLGVPFPVEKTKWILRKSE